MGSMAKLLDGKKAAKQVRATLKGDCDELRAKGVVPALAVVLVGDDPASAVYVRNKEKGCVEAGIESIKHALPAKTTEEELLALIDTLSVDGSVDGILVQLPLPDHIDSERVIDSIPAEKDVDGFHPYNVGRLSQGRPLFESCTPRGIMELMDNAGIELMGKDAVIVGRSNIVGKPMAMMLVARSATVTICHSKTKDLPEKVRAADVVVAAVGRAEFIKGDWIKEGAVVIDVGMNRADDGKLVGDVEYAGAAERASYITPVPGGVGPMTIAMLLKNTVEAAKARAGRGAAKSA